MRSLLEKTSSQVEHFSVDLDVFNKCRNSENEILIDGTLFDMKAWTQHGQKVELIAIHDKTEELLNKGMNFALRTGMLSNTGFLNKILILFALDYTAPYLHSASTFLNSLKELFTFFIAFGYTNTLDILTPPPRTS